MKGSVAEGTEPPKSGYPIALNHPVVYYIKVFNI